MIREDAKVHVLKTWPPYWEATTREDKLFELRKDDRGYRVGDVLVLRKFDPVANVYLSPWTIVVVTYRTEPGCQFVLPGHVAMGVRPSTYNESCTVLRKLRSENPNWPEELLTDGRE